ncbi:hypothetical protein ACLB2K_022917 [Fragaria x ananassa]
MGIFGSNKSFWIALLIFVLAAVQSEAETQVCYSKSSPCFLKQVYCPTECPSSSPTNPKAKVCYLNCNSPICKAECRRVLGRTYQPDFKNPAKAGVAMPVVEGEYKYKTTSLVSADCLACVFTQAGRLDQMDSRVLDYGKLDCTSNAFSGNGIVCRK